jgi:hypothetical protein
VISDLKNILSALVKADYLAQRLTNLARGKIEAVWGDLLPSEISELDTWLEEQEKTTQGRARIDWTYVRATLTSILQDREVFSRPFGFEPEAQPETR